MLEENVDNDYTNSTVLNFLKTKFIEQKKIFKKEQSLSIKIPTTGEEIKYSEIKYSNNNPSVNQCVEDFRILLIGIDYLMDVSSKAKKP